jgi:GNAT superfamily N-acetyltransferase
MRWTNGDLEIDDDKARIDLDRIVAWLAQSYWAGWAPPEITRRSWETAGVQLGLYTNGEMIGCARAITDFARFAYLSDVYVEPEFRGQGLGRWLVQVMLEHPEIQNVRWVLHTKDAHGLYRQFDFEPADETVMQRARPVRTLRDS